MCSLCFLVCYKGLGSSELVTMQGSDICATPVRCGFSACTQLPSCHSVLQALGEEGDVDGAQAAAAEAERLKMQRSLVESQAQARANAKAGRNLHQKVRCRGGNGVGWQHGSSSNSPH